MKLLLCKLQTKNALYQIVFFTQKFFHYYNGIFIIND